jgi:AcrR family transcriptional regulator
MRDMDRRVKYTKMVLRESLLELLQEKPINRISVTELCQNADVNRGTFYAHYSEPYDLLRQIEDELYEDIRNCFDGSAEKSMERTNLDLLMIINRNRELCRVILSENASSNFISRIYDIGSEYFRRRWSGSIEKMDMPEEYLYHYIATGNIEIIRMWLMNDDSRSPENIAAIISNLVRSVMHACNQTENAEEK